MIFPAFPSFFQAPFGLILHRGSKLLKPYQLNPSGVSLPLALNHDVEINEAGVSLGTKTLGEVGIYQD